jgi:replicative DNA helicase
MTLHLAVDNTTDPFASVAGIPPVHDRTLEASILGFTMVFPDLVRPVMDSVRPEFFFIEGHQNTWKALVALLAADIHPNVSAVHSYLKTRSKAVCGATLMDLEDMVEAAKTVSVRDPSAIQGQIALLVDHWRVRKAGEIGARLYEQSHRSIGDVQGFVDLGIAQLSTVAQAAGGKISDTKMEILRRLLAPKPEEQTRAIPLTTGFAELDRLLGGGNLPGGIRRGELFVIGARPGYGKTALALNIAMAQVIQAVGGTQFFSLEMNREQIYARCLAYASGVLVHRILNHAERDAEDHRRLTTWADKIVKLPIDVDDTKGLNADDVGTRLAIAIAHAKVQKALFVVDFIQELNPTRRVERARRHEQIEDAMKVLARVASEQNVACIVLAQLNRSIDGRSGDDARPNMSDIGDSSAIERYAHHIGLLWRRNKKVKEAVTLSLVKSRSGIEGDVEFSFDGSRMRFGVL